MMRRLASLTLLTLLAAFLMSCNADYEAMGENRLQFARKQLQKAPNLTKAPIVVAVIVNEEEPDYLRGIELAVKEINQRPNKLLGRTVEIHTEFEAKNVEESMPSIQRISSNPKVVAVLGHRKSSIAIPASAIYERSQIVFLSSFATADTLTGHKFKYVFRMMPNTKSLASQQANIAKSLGYKKVVTLHSRDPVNRELAFLFEDAAIVENIKIIKRASFFSDAEGNRNYRPIISQFNNEDFDAIYIAAGAKSSGNMVRQIREMGLRHPIIGSDALSRETYNNIAGDIAGERASDNTIVPSIYKAATDSPISRHFLKAFQKEYQKQPNQRAAQGYDSMHLLAKGIEHSKSTLGPTLSSTLHYMPAWVGVTGIHAFDEDGELRGKKYLFQVWKRGKLVDLPAIHHFYLLDRFVQSVKAEYGKDYPVTDFAQTFKEKMHDDEHKIYLLDLAHELLRFKRIGIIYENNKDGRTEAYYDLLTKFVERKNQAYSIYLAKQKELEEKQYSTSKKYSKEAKGAADKEKSTNTQQTTQNQHSTEQQNTTTKDQTNLATNQSTTAGKSAATKEHATENQNTAKNPVADNSKTNKPIEDKKLITIEECPIPFSLLNDQEAQKELFNCYGRLSLKMDALLVPSYYRDPNNPQLIKQLDAALGAYKIPSISISSDGDPHEASINLTKRNDLKLHARDRSAGGMQAYNGLLRGLRVHEFFDQLSGLPEIRVNLTDLQEDELPEKPLLDISTDLYLHSHAIIQENK